MSEPRWQTYTLQRATIEAVHYHPSATNEPGYSADFARTYGLVMRMEKNGVVFIYAGQTLLQPNFWLMRRSDGTLVVISPQEFARRYQSNERHAYDEETGCRGWCLACHRDRYIRMAAGEPG